MAAIFWDRDGTLIDDPGYLRDPQQVKLLPGAAKALRRLAAAGFENIIVTNQSGVARGLLDEPTVERIHARLGELLAEKGTGVDGIYYCPYLDGEQAVVEKYRQDSELRKPKPGMLLKAATERKIELRASWSIGDSVRDAEAARAAGCRTILVNWDGQQKIAAGGPVDYVVGSLGEAVNIVLENKTHQTEEKPERAPATNGDSSALLQEILSFLKMADRRSRTEDFSLAQLLGAACQILAMLALVWAVFGMNEPQFGTQIVRLMFTLVLQLLALTLFVMARRK